MIGITTQNGVFWANADEGLGKLLPGFNTPHPPQLMHGVNGKSFGNMIEIVFKKVA